MADPWPAEVPASLWTFNQLSAEELVQVPMMGVKFASGFLYAFAFGCIFIAVFAWNRFRIHTDVQSSSRALTELGPSDIGGHAALIRAYFIYAGAILLLYVSLTFFGKLLFQMATMVPVIGFSVDTNDLRFDSPQWPLMLAFGFAGLAQMLPPVAALEGWLRRRAYRAVGIPVRLEQTMRNLIVTLERAGPGNDLAPLCLGRELERYRQQWKTLIEGHAWAGAWAHQRPTQADELKALLSQLELLISWSKHKRGSWPGHEVSQAVRERERAYVRETEDLLTSFQQRMTEKPEDDGQGLASARKARFGDYLADTIRTAQALRFDLVGVLAIFLERDSDSPDVAKGTADPGYTDPALRKLLSATTRADSPGTGPESGLFAGLVAVFVLCAAAAWQGLQAPVGQLVETTNLYGILISALVETLRIASLTWIPLLAAFSLRQYWWDNGDWARARYSTRPDQYATQILTCLMLGMAAAILGLSAMAALKAFFIAATQEYFTTLLFTAKPPFLLYYPTQVVILPGLIPLAILSADLRTKAHQRLVWGVMAALTVGSLSLAHTLSWSSYLFTDCVAATTILTKTCWQRLDLVSHLLLMGLAFLAVGVFGDLPERRHADSRRAPRVRRRKVTAPLLLALVTATALAPARTHAQPPASTTPTGPIPVAIGFRTDIAPFSYQKQGEDPRPFHGYLADMCFDIFTADARYVVKAVPVNASNRLEFFEQSKVVMLCDAFTMRFSERGRSSNGIYSPIVFVSGVSYLQTTSRLIDSISLGFVLDTTSRDVALKTCQVDHFRVFTPDRRKFLTERCALRWGAAVMAERWRKTPPAKQALGSDTSRTQVDTVQAKIKDRDLEEEFLHLHRVAENLQRLVTDDPATRLSQGTDDLMTAVLEIGKCRGNPDTDGKCGKLVQSLTNAGCNQKPSLEPRVPFEERPWEDYNFCPKSDHVALIEWFCTSPQDRRRIYLGDRELIVAKRDAWVRDVGSCPVERSEGAELLSYEPYAFLVRKDHSELAAFVQQRIYELFSDRNRMIERFTGNFPGRRMSVPLAYLFLLNAVENDTLFLPNADLSPEAAAGNRP
ncbi:hypothetical protein [Paracoccus yeei]|uniref:hypothetical protein n=2 Tax=Paracoccus yeei TaxID=147645 RepID=UPI0028D424B8|nr:hypothetical protein [Paracoccus yeei]